MATNGESAGVWDSEQCALLLMDYQDNTLGNVFEQDRRVIELNVRTVAAAALSLNIPVVLSTIGVGMGLNGPTIPSLQAALPDHVAIDRTTTDAWEDPAFLAAVKATGRTRLVMGGILTSVCLAYPVVSALADGYQVTFIEDAVGDVADDAGVGQRREHMDLAREALGEVALPVGDDLDGDGPAGDRIAGAEHRAHAAGADRLLELEPVVELLPGHHECCCPASSRPGHRYAREERALSITWSSCTEGPCSQVSIPRPQESDPC